MNVQNIAEAVVTLVVAVIGVAVPYIAKFLKSNKTAETLVSILPTLAKDAVVALQKLGVTTYIEGELKKSKAVKIVESALQNLGFKETDAVTIENAIESAYASLIKDGTLTQYVQKTEAQEVADEAAQQAEKATELANAQKELTEAQAKVAELSK
ncbi:MULTISPECIES: phage holin, LLH family [Liquorilactobacillus]|uniref:phage holin, LLH family n=1 Tax=Liquorilactobacillus TaxID=2767888 RepID=UPI0039ECAABF